MLVGGARGSRPGPSLTPDRPDRLESLSHGVEAKLDRLESLSDRPIVR
jgi:hypothetical protein